MKLIWALYMNFCAYMANRHMQIAHDWHVKYEIASINVQALDLCDKGEKHE